MALTLGQKSLNRVKQFPLGSEADLPKACRDRLLRHALQSVVPRRASHLREKLLHGSAGSHLLVTKFKNFGLKAKAMIWP